MVLAGLAFVTMFANIPDRFDFVPEGWRLRFEHFVEPRAGYFPEISHAAFSGPVALLSIAAAVIASGAAVLYYRKVNALGPMATELPDGLTTRSGVARLGYRVLENKFYLDWLYTDVIVASVKGPLARLTNRFNQEVLDGVVNGAAAVSKEVATFTYTYIDQKVVDGAVNGSGLSASETGGVLRRIQSGRVQQYAALMFAAAALLAGVFVLAI
jgi:NADH-quinone oxidoreductase subunit L